ncbi:MAG TPA: MFS transporter [Tianweitania sediminis]|jgi:MFS family permease|nr:MFS transporter [Tianweitania sediminis]
MSLAAENQSKAFAPVASDGAVWFAISSVIASMALTAVGNGMMFAFIPMRLGFGGYDPAWAGSILTALSAGGIAGCLLTGRLVSRVGHARSFLAFSALIILSNALVGAAVDPWLWMVARAIYGFSICGMFIVAQSWLNDAVSNAVRGRVMAVFYVAYISGLGCGSLLAGFVDLRTASASLISIGITALAALPVCLTRLPPPPAPEAASVALRRAWRISPVGVAGMLAVGGLSMMITGFAPIHATASGMTQEQVATLMFAMPVGTMLFQLPFGWLSDRTDRRYVLIAAAALVVVAGLIASFTDGSGLALTIAIYVIWSGASESIYSLSNAHANDRADKDDLVLLASTMLFAWSISGFVVPGLGTVLTAFFGTQSFMSVAVAIGAAFCIFVVTRVLSTGSRAPLPGLTFAPMAAQTPPAVDLAFPTDAPRAD